MTRPGIEPRSPGPLANTLTAGPMSRYLYIYIPIYIYIYKEVNERDKANRNISFIRCISQLVSTLGNRQEKKFCEEKVL